MARSRTSIIIAALALLAAARVWAEDGLLELSLLSEPERIAVLRARAAREGWTFTIGPTSAGKRSLSDLCGLVVPEEWWLGQRFNASGRRDDGRHHDRPPPCGLPAAFDWREHGGCPPIRDQGLCGSCWAFGTVAPLEANILIHDGVLVDLSEQWLVSCNRSGWGCGGGWWAHDYHEWKTDICGGTGAVLEADFPYVAAKPPCGCPYAHRYAIDGWSYIGTPHTIPPVEAIKRAILGYGPVSAAVRVSSAFQQYTGGIYNACSGGPVNHAVVLVGWDDHQGTAGVWILHNSWGTDWGEAGYMLIEYGCSSVGYAACYVEYAGGGTGTLVVTPAALDFGDVDVGGSTEETLTVRNVGSDALAGSAAGLAAPFSFVGSTDYSLEPGQSQVITVRFAPLLQGTFSGVAQFTSGRGAAVSVAGTAVGAGPGNTCADAPGVGDGTFAGSNVGATTDKTASCGDGGTGDVWWRYVAPHAGVALINTVGSDFDTVLSVRAACSAAELACNDDCPESAPASCLELPVMAGDSYCVRVAGRVGETGNIVLNIVTTTPPRAISGVVATVGGIPVAGVSMAGLPGQPITGDDGQYVATVSYGFSGTVAPSKAGYTFTPPNRSYVNLTTDQLDQSYAATPPTFRIAGRLTNQFGQPISSAVISGLPNSPVTNADGRYSTFVPMGFSGSAVPQKNACSFDPPSRTYANVAGDLIAENYVGFQQTGALKVLLEPPAACAAGAAWRVDGGDWRAGGQTVGDLPADRHAVSYAFVSGWTSPGDEQVMIEPNQTTVLRRSYTQRRYTLELISDPPTAGLLLADPLPDEAGRYAQDTVVTLTAIPDPGFRVLSWGGADRTPAAGELTNTASMTGNRIVVVQFSVAPFTMYQLSTRVAGGEGSLTPDRGAYPAGTVVALRATPADGHRVAGWSGTDDDTSVADANAVTMDGNRAVSVAFEPAADCNANGAPDGCESDGESAGHDDANGSASDRTAGQGAPGTGLGLCGVGVAETLFFALVAMGFLHRRVRRMLLPGDSARP